MNQQFSSFHIDSEIIPNYVKKNFYSELINFDNCNGIVSSIINFQSTSFVAEETQEECLNHLKYYFSKILFNCNIFIQRSFNFTLSKIITNLLQEEKKVCVLTNSKHSYNFFDPKRSFTIKTINEDINLENFPKYDFIFIDFTTAVENFNIFINLIDKIEKIKKINENIKIIFTEDKTCNSRSFNLCNYQLINKKFQPDLLILGNGIIFGYSDLCIVLKNHKFENFSFSFNKEVISSTEYLNIFNNLSLSLNDKLLNVAKINLNIFLNKLTTILQKIPSIKSIKGQGMSVIINFESIEQMLLIKKIFYMKSIVVSCLEENIIINPLFQENIQEYERFISRIKNINEEYQIFNN